LTQAAAERTPSDSPRLGCVRLGNVIGSTGSVVPLFKQQIGDGGPVTITEPEMTRFAISKRRAAAFIVNCVVDQEDGQIHAPKIGRLRLIDLAEAMIREYAPQGTPPAEIDIETIGRRPGERAHEYLIGPTEINRTVEHEKRYSIEPPSSLGREVDETNSPDLPSSGYRSDSSPFMDHDEIIKLIEDTTETWAASTTDVKSATVIGKND
jgi:UDP-N-acetylglucosamine 4,6-dehydratase